MLRRLEATLAVADKERSLIITGAGDVLEPEHGILAIGSGGPYAQAAARALLEHSSLSARDIVDKALAIRSEERRVGKEWRSRRWRCAEQKKSRQMTHT